jgi:hypothetical protein
VVVGEPVAPGASEVTAAQNPQPPPPVAHLPL